jgi:hypothetical protein
MRVDILPTVEFCDAPVPVNQRFGDPGGREVMEKGPAAVAQGGN